MQTFAYKYFTGLIIAAHDDEPPPEDEWAAMCELLTREARNKPIDAFIVSDGGSPNAKQRAGLAAIPGNERLRQAVVTRSTVVRGIVTALTWLKMPVRAFAPAELEAALNFLELRGERRRATLTTAADLRARLAGATSTLEAFRAVRAKEDDYATFFDSSVRDLRKALARGESRAGGR